MKKFLLIILLSFSKLGFSQSFKNEKKKNLTNVDAHKMAVYFGCESFTDNNDLLKCFNQNLKHDIQTQIAYFSNISDYLHIETAQAKLGFYINEDGRFSDIDAQGDNPIFNSVAISSMILLNNKMDRAKIKIEPAKKVDDKAIRMKFNMPLRYEAATKANDFEKFPSENRVLFTLKTDEENIEVRIDKEYNLKTYGNNGEREYYLGKFSNLFEMASVEPYASAFDTAFKSGISLITKGQLDGKEYTLQIKNFFENDPNAEVVILVFREENGSWAEYYEYKSKKEFNQSKFSSLTYR